MARPHAADDTQRVKTPPFSIEVQDTRGAARLTVTGELDLQTAPALRQALGDLPRGAAAVLDLSGVTFIDSTGIAAIVRGYTAHRAAGGRLVLSASLGAIVEQALGTACLLEHLPIEPD